MPTKPVSKTTRISLDISVQDHKRIKVLASAEGVPLKDFVIQCIHEKINPKKKPNAKTRKSMEDARNGKTLKAKDIAGLYKHLGI